MPGFDGTGPRGMGPMIGRGSGYCMKKVFPDTHLTAPIPGFVYKGKDRRYCRSLTLKKGSTDGGKVYYCGGGQRQGRNR